MSTIKELKRELEIYKEKNRLADEKAKLKKELFKEKNRGLYKLGQGAKSAVEGTGKFMSNVQKSINTKPPKKSKKKMSKPKNLFDSLI